MKDCIEFSSDGVKISNTFVFSLSLAMDDIHKDLQRMDHTNDPKKCRASYEDASSLVNQLRRQYLFSMAKYGNQTK